MGPVDLPLDGERFIPGMAGSIELEHIHRYALAKNLAAGKVVLDIASGEGYGSRMLADVAARVIGVDISEDAIAHARHTYRAPNLEFRTGSCAAIPIDDRTVDLVVSFETIEHHAQHEEMLDEIARVLKPDGVLFISSPNKHEYSDVPGFVNPFHVKELYLKQFSDLLARRFSFVAMHGQRPMHASTIAAMEPGSREFEHLFADDKRVAHNALVRPIYFIAVASNEAVPDLPNSVMEASLPELEAEAKGVQRELERMLSELKAADEGLRKQATELEAYRSLVAELQSTITAYEHQSGEYAATDLDRRKELESAYQRLESQREELRLAYAEIERRGADLGAYEGQAVTLQGQVKAYEAQAVELLARARADEEKLSEAYAQLAAQQSDLRAYAEQTESFSAQLRAYEQQAATMAAELRKYAEQAPQLAARWERAQAELRAAKDTIENQGQALSASQARERHIAHARDELGARLQIAVGERDTLRAQLDELRTRRLRELSDPAFLARQMLRAGLKRGGRHDGNENEG